MVPADAAPRTVTYALMTGPVSVSYQPSGQLSFNMKNVANGWHFKVNCMTLWNLLLKLYHPYSASFQNAVSSTWCWMVCVRLVVHWAIMRTWRRATVVSATLPVAAVQGPWQMTVRPARHLAPNSTRVHVPKIAPLGLTMKLKLWNVKVSFPFYRCERVRFWGSVEYAGYYVLCGTVLFQIRSHCLCTGVYHLWQFFPIINM